MKNTEIQKLMQDLCQLAEETDIKEVREACNKFSTAIQPYLFHWHEQETQPSLLLAWRINASTALQVVKDLYAPKAESAIFISRTQQEQMIALLQEWIYQIMSMQENITAGVE